MIDKILGFVFDSYEELAEALHRGQVTEGYCVQDGEIRFMNIEILEYHEKRENGIYDSEEAFFDNSFVFHGSEEIAEQGEPVDVENTSASEQDNTVENSSCSRCIYRDDRSFCGCYSSVQYNHAVRHEDSCLFFLDKYKFNDVFRSGG